MKINCTNDKHEVAIHDCIEKIIATFKHDMISGARNEPQQRIALNCAQVNKILVIVMEAKYHATDHVPEWESVSYRGRSNLACGKCGKFFTNKVIESARRLCLL